ncbi:MAG: hypothetical protein LBN93_12160 [Candidatus Symbiothrix sp.]|jgi:hypothetical protein|nr:hypothetical protein [Candidatus Symbiothrix sp.]
MAIEVENIQEHPAKSKVMSTIAYTVTFVVVGVTLAIAIICIIKYSKIEDAVGFIAQTLLPLWGTWFGTVLAFYFTKENLDAANKSNRALLNRLSANDQQFASRSVCMVMKPLDKIITLSKEQDGNRTLKDILAAEEFEPFNRFPIFNDRKIEYMVHRLIITNYLLRQDKEEQDTKTLNDLLLGDSTVQDVLRNSIGFVPETATLLDAKNEMDKLTNCEDVFVTNDGTSSGDVIGWITDNDIRELGQV